MSQRYTADTITDDALDALYAERDRYREACADVTRSLAVIGGALPESLVRYRNRISLARNRLLAALAPSPAADSTKETGR